MTDTDKVLRQKINLINRVFNTASLLRSHPDNRYIKKYYQASKIGYSVFHSSTDSIHMAISRDGVYKEDDLLEPARIIEKYVKQKKSKNVLELATGRGAVSAYLAERHPEISFSGIELSPAQFKFAKKRSKLLANYHPTLGDYQDLSRYKGNTFDVIFVVEALCYSTDKETVFRESKRVMKKDGVLIIIDGYNLKDRSKMTRNEILACKLTEKSMALDVFEDYQSVMSKVKKQGFKTIYSENVSEFIQPNLRKFEKLAGSYFRRRKTAKLVNYFLPKKFVYNTIAGLLMPDVVGQKLLGYYVDILELK